MNEELKEKWLERLKTGEKVNAKLCSGTGAYCALGHLVIADGGGFKDCEGSYVPVKSGEQIGYSASLAISYLEEVDLSPNKYVKIVSLSDGNVTFDKVIKYIEKNL